MRSRCRSSPASQARCCQRCSGSRFGRWRPLSIGIVGGAVALVFLIGHFEYLPFTIWVCVYNFFWNMTHPYLLGSMASFDRRGRVVVYAVAIQMLGLAIGPALAASVISPVAL